LILVSLILDELVIRLARGICQAGVFAKQLITKKRNATVKESFTIILEHGKESILIAEGSNPGGGDFFGHL
jgi:hypothetical protein